MGGDTFTLDVRIEIDDLDIEDLRRALIEATDAGQTVSRVMMRDVQWKALKRRARDRYGDPDLTRVFGHDVVIEEDGLTPRQRSVKRIEAELGRTRAQQVADFLRDEDDSAHLFDFSYDLSGVRLQLAHRGEPRAARVPNEGRRLLRDRDGTRAKATTTRKAAAMTEVIAQFGTLGMSAGEATNALAANLRAANLRRMSR